MTTTTHTYPHHLREDIESFGLVLEFEWVDDVDVEPHWWAQINGPNDHGQDTIYYQGPARRLATFWHGFQWGVCRAQQQAKEQPR